MGTRRLRERGRVNFQRSDVMTDGNSEFQKAMPVAGKSAAGLVRSVVTREGAAMGLGHPMRWSILEELSKGEPRMVVELSRTLGISATVVSKHVCTLLAAGLVRRGQAGMYTIPKEFLPAQGAEESGPRVVDYGVVVVRFR